MKTTTVLLADDHRFFRAGVRALLQELEGFEIIGEAGNGNEAIEQALKLKPDVILMDVQMPGTNGVDATRRIVQVLPDVAVLMVTMFEDDEMVLSAMRAGARGYILKDAGAEEMERSIKAVANGEVLFGAGVAKRLLSLLNNRERKPELGDGLRELTERELDVLKQVARGKTNQQIADDLVLSLKTVRNHVSNILSKLGVTNREAAADQARKSGLMN